MVLLFLLELVVPVYRVLEEEDEGFRWEEKMEAILKPCYLQLVANGAKYDFDQLTTDKWSNYQWDAYLNEYQPVDAFKLLESVRNVQ